MSNHRYTPHGTTPQQVRAVCELLIETLAVGPEAVTDYTKARKVVQEKELGTAQIASVLGRLTEISFAHGLDRVSALVRRANGQIGDGFWVYYEPDVPPSQRSDWLRDHTRYLHENAEALTRLLRFIIDELNRQ